MDLQWGQAVTFRRRYKVDDLLSVRWNIDVAYDIHVHPHDL
jgi:hypothetical protein